MCGPYDNYGGRSSSRSSTRSSSRSTPAPAPAKSEGTTSFKHRTRGGNGKFSKKENPEPGTSGDLAPA